MPMSTTSVPRYRSQTFVRAGFSSLHGMHHDDQKLMTTTFPLYWSSEIIVPSASEGRANAGAGLPTVPVLMSCGSRRNARVRVTASPRMSATAA